MAVNVAVYVFLIKNIDDLWLDLGILFFILFGSLFPDIDSPNSLLGRWVFPLAVVTKHRGFMHSLLGMVVFSLPIILFSFIHGLVFAVSYLSHLICDSTTKSGVKFLYPFIKKSYGLKMIRTGEDLLLFLMLIPYILSVFEKVM